MNAELFAAARPRSVLNGVLSEFVEKKIFVFRASIFGVDIEAASGVRRDDNEFAELLFLLKIVD